MIINVENVIPCLHMADYLQIDDLKRRVNDYLTNNLSKNNVIPILKKALELLIEEVYEKCTLVLAKNFNYLYSINASFNFLPLPLMIDLLKHGSLTVANEYHVSNT